MYLTTEKEKAFLNEPKSSTSSSLKELTDRELIEKQTICLMNIEKSNEKIKANLQFWFYLAIVGSIFAFVFLIN